jgi:hypothetical protein
MELRLIGIVTLLWAGMILGISFLESWVKFRAPSITKPIGLDVGRTVFRMFHKVQNVFLILIIYMSLTTQISMVDWIILCGIILICCMQFLWLFPRLTTQVDIILAGGQPTSSLIHSLYGGTELIKLILLLIFSVKLIL